MAIKSIDYRQCRVCELRIQGACPVPESCFQDVFRADEEGKPQITYPKDCVGCHDYYYACQTDCPKGAVEVSPIFYLHSLPF